MSGTLLTQIFSFINDRGTMYHSHHMWKSCSEPTPLGPHIDWHGDTSGQSGILTHYDQCDTHISWSEILKILGYPKSLHIRAARDWDIPSKIRFDAIYPSVALLASHHFWVAHSLITTKTLVMGATLLTKGFRLCNDQEFMYHSPYILHLVLSQRFMELLYTDVVSRQFSAIYWRNTTKLIHISWSEILACLIIPSFSTFELHVIEMCLQNSVLMLHVYIRWWPSWCHVSSGRHTCIGWLRPTLVVGGNLLTQSFGFPDDQESMYHSPYMWKSCSEPSPYGPHIDWRGVTSVQGVILADYDQTGTHVLKWNPHKRGYPMSLHISATRDWISTDGVMIIFYWIRTSYMLVTTSHQCGLVGVYWFDQPI